MYSMNVYRKVYFDVTDNSFNKVSGRLSECPSVSKIVCKQSHDKRANKVITQCKGPHYEDTFQSALL